MFANRPALGKQNDLNQQGPVSAEKLDVRDGEILRVTSPHGTVEAPVYVHPGLHPDVIATSLASTAPA